MLIPFSFGFSTRYLQLGPILFALILHGPVAIPVAKENPPLHGDRL